MVQKNIVLTIGFLVLFTVILVLIANLGKSNAFSCSNQNVTLTNSSGFVCTDQWVNVVSPVALINRNIIAKGISIDNTFSITGNSTLNTSAIINRGNATIDAVLLGGETFENYGTLTLIGPVFINFSYFLNKGIIINKNYLNNGGYANAYFSYEGNSYGCGGESYPVSYAGSGGGSLATYSQCNGGNTLAEGGSGQVTSYTNHVLYPIYNSSGSHVYSSPSNYSFDLSVLNSAGGASYNDVNSTSFFMRGGSGVSPLIIISKFFNNTGRIYNQGQSINYSTIKNASKLLAFGIVGAGGGGVIEVISGRFVNNGTFNVSGGRIYLNGSVGLPAPYTAVNLGYGGNGNVFFFKANSKLLSGPIYNYTSNQKQQNNYDINISGNYSKEIQNYSVIAKVQPLPGCSLNGIYVNLEGDYNNNSFLEAEPINDPVFSVNRSINNPYLYLSGNNPLLHYYSNTSVVLSNASNTSTENLNLTRFLPVGISFEGGQNLSFNLLKGNNTIFSGATLSKHYLYKLGQGNYYLSFETGQENYTYSLHVAPNCLGYENITILPGKPYYIYNSLNISSMPFTLYKTNTVVNDITDYKDVNSCGFNVSELMGLDKLILNSISSMNNSISAASYDKVNYTNILSREINYTNYMLNTYNTKLPKKLQKVYLNQTGLNLLSYYNNGNFTKEVFQVNNNGTINLSYGTNKSIEIVLTKRTQPNIFVSTENGIIKAFSYVPSLFLGFLGGL